MLFADIIADLTGLVCIGMVTWMYFVAALWFYRAYMRFLGGLKEAGEAAVSAIGTVASAAVEGIDKVCSSETVKEVAKEIGEAVAEAIEEEITSRIDDATRN